MKERSLFFFSGLLLPAAAICQDVAIRVAVEGEPVEYAFVQSNDRYVGTTDSTGTVVVPLSELSEGDVLSARYVGMISGEATFSAGVLSYGIDMRCEDLPASILSVGKVVPLEDYYRRVEKYGIRFTWDIYRVAYCAVKGNGEKFASGEVSMFVRRTKDDDRFRVLSPPGFSDPLSVAPKIAWAINNARLQAWYMLTANSRLYSSRYGILKIRRENMEDGYACYNLLSPTCQMLAKFDGENLLEYRITQNLSDQEVTVFPRIVQNRILLDRLLVRKMKATDQDYTLELTVIDIEPGGRRMEKKLFHNAE